MREVLLETACGCCKLVSFESERDDLRVPMTHGDPHAPARFDLKSDVTYSLRTFRWYGEMHRSPSGDELFIYREVLP
jgi:hypothetical protein